MNNVLQGIVTMWVIVFLLAAVSLLVRFAIHHPFVGGSILITLFGAVTGLASERGIE